jgi:hypothetical protein
VYPWKYKKVTYNDGNSHTWERKIIYVCPPKDMLNDHQIGRESSAHCGVKEADW